MHRRFQGKPVITPEEIPEKESVCVLICTIRPDVVESIRQMCRKRHMTPLLLDEVILGLHKDEVLQCFDLFEDDRSREVYLELTRARILGKDLKPGICEGNQYFAIPPFAEKDPQEVFINCGAYDGDSICEYVQNREDRFRRIIAFEPDPQNYHKLADTVEKLCEEKQLSPDKFELYAYGIGGKDSICKVSRYEDNHGIGSKLLEEGADEGEDCRVVSLDSFLAEPYDFLKADIESYEYQMLLGAKQGIRKNHPKLAICIYHNAVDFYQIPLLIRQIGPEYHIAVRQHREDTSETIVYAWV